MNADEVEKERRDDGSADEQTWPGSEAKGQGARIPSSGAGVGIGAGTEANTFEPEEDPEATGDYEGVSAESSEFS